MSRQSRCFLTLLLCLLLAFGIEVVLFHRAHDFVAVHQDPKEAWEVATTQVASWWNKGRGMAAADTPPHRAAAAAAPSSGSGRLDLPDHLLPILPTGPAFAPVPDAEEHVANLMAGRPTMAGVVALLQTFVAALHEKNVAVVTQKSDGHKVIANFFELTERYLRPFDALYRNRSIFPLREDGSVFLSVAAFRERQLRETLKSAFSKAKDPEKLFVGIVVQNCFGQLLPDGTMVANETSCLSGPTQVGTKPNGQKIREHLPEPPDRNQVEEFCNLPNYQRYCDNGQIRTLYLHDMDSQGPSMARYYASKLYGGETYYAQIDSHLRFASDWDAKFIAELKLTSSYPKSLLSAYPPGFEQFRFIPKVMNIDRSQINNHTVIESPGTRLCHCGSGKGKNAIVTITQSKAYPVDAAKPTQHPFLGAGIVFAHGNLLRDVPFDPYLPWTFMGEEILLSMRAWTAGYDLYGPRKNLVIHQYRDGKSGRPSSPGTVTRVFAKGYGNEFFKKTFLHRIKHLLGYPSDALDVLREKELDYVLVDREHYGMGSERSQAAFLKHAGMWANATSGQIHCTKKLSWCMNHEKV